MRAIFEREWLSYFRGFTGYLFCFFLLLFTGIYSMVNNIIGAYAEFQGALDRSAFVFLLCVPVLTMRVIAEEKRQKTDQLLYSLPVSLTKIVLGKYFAMLAVLAIPTVIIGTYPLIFSLYGDVPLRAAYGALLAFFLLGAGLISIGMFVSSVTENQASAAIFTFLAIIVDYLLVNFASLTPGTALASMIAFSIIIVIIGIIMRTLTKNTIASASVAAVLEAALLVVYFRWPGIFEGLFGKCIAQLGLFNHFDTFINGVFDLTAIVYFLSVTAIFIFLTIQAMEKRRWAA